jgi:hypothetical protein
MWTTALELDSRLQRTAGSSTVLRDAVRRGADLQVMSAFYHDEHVDTGSRQHELVEEAMDMRATFLVGDRWCAGAQTLRQPVELPADFGPRPSLSLFLYNEDGGQAIARPYLDGPPMPGPREEAASLAYPEMPKYREFSRFDDGTNAPSSNFIYHFEYLRFRVNDDYREVLSHDEKGVVTGGSMEELAAAFRRGAEWKVAIRGLCGELTPPGHSVQDSEVFVHLGSCYFYTDQRLFIAGTHPTLRVQPQMPLRFRSGNWDYGWYIVRTDGYVAKLIYDPYTLEPRRETGRYAMRWFCRRTQGEK